MCRELGTHTGDLKITGTLQLHLKASLTGDIALQGQRLTIQAKLGFNTNFRRNFCIDGRPLINKLENIVLPVFQLLHIVTNTDATFHVKLFHNGYRAFRIHFQGNLQATNTWHFITANINLEIIAGEFAEIAGNLSGNLHIGIKPKGNIAARQTNVGIAVDLRIL